ncbi:flagellar motor protein MotB [Craterilacuibacter sinensis]|uniref:Flagellar motor protein MotB n=1 Tax=Craterilacuibacter sinensis TaxID=2686017 RepID=A0A845BPM7_9NEIS|nr:flagellar motor protein MotB [Craterilacuibacter sinensis]MXR37128.1 flagellar motor protein MotB [Craterilacuibacter sinensis]
MADESQRPIIVKRIKKGGHGHHGGAWKIAYADFMTAMMAFFLLMWLLGSASQGTLNGIAEYFKTPLKVALSGGSGAGDATSMIKGGGTDLTRQAGQVKRGYKHPAELAQEKQRLQALQQKIQADINTSNVLKFYKNQLRLEMTPDGLKIQIVDEKNRPMFASGSADILPHTREILRELGYELNAVPNMLSVSGHTDAAPFAGGQKGYSNWELSADRANAARRELLLGGMDPVKILRVVGLANANPLIPQNQFSPENRRIAIVILNDDAVDRIRSDGLSAAQHTAADVASEPVATAAGGEH